MPIQKIRPMRSIFQDCVKFQRSAFQQNVTHRTITLHLSFQSTNLLACLVRLSLLKNYMLSILPALLPGIHLEIFHFLFRRVHVNRLDDWCRVSLLYQKKRHLRIYFHLLLFLFDLQSNLPTLSIDSLLYLLRHRERAITSRLPRF